MRIALGSDRNGLDYKKRIIAHLKELGHETIDVGTEENVPCDTPVFAAKAAKLLGAQRVYIAHTDSWGHLGEDLQDTIQAFTREGIDHKLMNK